MRLVLGLNRRSHITPVVLIHHHHQNAYGGDGPLRSPPFTIISRCPGLQASRTARFVALRTSRSQLIRDLPGFCLQPGSGIVGKQFNRCVEGVMRWSAFWHASDLSKESQPSVADNRTYTSGRPDFSATHYEFVTKSAHLIPRVRGAGTTRVKLVVFSSRC